MTSHRKAFTLIELLVVVAIIIALLAILLPSMGRAIAAAESAVCRSNLRQLTFAYLGYTSDNFGMLMQGVPNNNDFAWVRKGAGEDPIRQGAMFKYVEGSVGVFRCPSDAIPTRARSYSIPAPMFGQSWSTEHMGGTNRLTGVVNASAQFVFLDESDDRDSHGTDYWNDGSWMTWPYAQWYWLDHLGLYHGGGLADNFGFLDGHTEYRRYTDPRTIEYHSQKQGTFGGGFTLDFNDDWLWVISRFRQMPSNSINTYRAPWND